jgi:hypothetical protein
VPGIHVFLGSFFTRRENKTWMAGTSPAMTKADGKMLSIRSSNRQSLPVVIA